MSFDYITRRNSTREEYFNLLRKRNIYNTDSLSYNCGGYALHTYAWYQPYDSVRYDVSTLLAELYRKNVIGCYDENGDDEDAAEYLVDLFDTYNQDEFKDLHPVCVGYIPSPDEEIICFRAGVEIFPPYCEEDCVGFDVDFHYLLYRDGVWSSKCGGDPIEYYPEYTLDQEDDLWNEEFYFYNSTSRWYVRKI